MNKRSLILALTAAVAAAVLAAKHVRRHEALAPQGAQSGKPAGPGLYLFLDERDHDAGCERVYDAFEAAKKELPSGFGAMRVDAERQPDIAEKLGVRMLPTILLIGRDGAVSGRIEGEGDEAVGKVHELVSRIPRGK